MLNKNSIFTELDHRLSVVHRWAILNRVHEQSVAEHSFNVARISERIARKWYNMDSQDVNEIVVWAMHHDDPESISSDLPAMVKPYFNEELMIEDHREYFEDMLYDCPPAGSLARHIIKIADKLEGYHFLCLEIVMGNKSVQDHLEKEPGIIKSWIMGNMRGHNLNVALSHIDEAVNEILQSTLSERISKRGR